MLRGNNSNTYQIEQNESFLSLVEVSPPEMTPEKEKETLEKFVSQVLIEMKKVNFFYYENCKYYQNRICKIKEQLEFIAKNKMYQELKVNLEVAIKELFKELMCMKSYCELNLKAIKKITKKFAKVTKVIENKENKEITESIILQIQNYLKNSKLNNSLEELSLLQTEIEKMFDENFFDKYKFKAIKILKDYGSQNFFATHLQSFYFGFFVGLIVILLLLCILIGHYFKIDMDDDAKFKTIFPMFRGYLVFILYFWYLGLNVYAWNLAHINYKLAFNFDNHYSDVISILKRAAFFSFVVVSMLLCYMILRTHIPVIYDLVSFIPLEFTPLCCWIILFGYIFSPFNNFNFLGRIYFFNLLFESMANVTHKIDFRHVWFTDQLTSLIGPLRDLEYTACYYTHYFASLKEKKKLCSSQRPIVLLLACFPHFVRFLQCARVCYDEGKLFPSALNCGKYTFSILVAVSSYYSGTIPFFKKIWLIIAILSTIYSFSWDIKCDYGLLQQGPNYPLRNKLSYSKKGLYYTAIIVNFFLRSAWVLTISPDVVYHFIRPEFFLMMIYLFEAFRRGMWNFFRVELKYIEICKEFKVCSHVELPLKKLKNGSFELRDVKLFEAKNQNKRLDKLRKISFLNEGSGIPQLGKKESNASNDSLQKYGLKHMSSSNISDVSKESINIDDYKEKFQNYLSHIDKKTQDNINKSKMIEMTNIKKKN